MSFRFIQLIHTNIPVFSISGINYRKTQWNGTDLKLWWWKLKFLTENCVLLSAKKALSFLAQSLYNFCIFHISPDSSPSPRTSPPLKHKPRNFYHLHLFLGYYNQINSVWRNVDKFYKEYTLNELAKCKVHFKQIQAEFM